MNDRDQLYVVHITEAIERVRRFTAAGRATFMADDMIQSALEENHRDATGESTVIPR